MRTIANSIVFQCQRELVGKFNSKLHRMGCKILSGGKILNFSLCLTKEGYHVLQLLSQISEIQGFTMAKFPQT